MKLNKQHWGADLLWADTEYYSAQMILINEGDKTPYLYHKKRDITLFVLEGEIVLTLNGSNKMLKSKDTVHIPPKHMWRLMAIKGESIILEAGTKIEDDVVIVER